MWAKEILALDPNPTQRGDLREGLCLVDFASCFCNPRPLDFVLWTMVSAKGVDLIPTISTHDSSTIPHIGSITHVIDKENADSARS